MEQHVALLEKLQILKKKKMTAKKIVDQQKTTIRELTDQNKLSENNHNMIENLGYLLKQIDQHFQQLQSLTKDDQNMNIINERLLKDILGVSLSFHERTIVCDENNLLEKINHAAADLSELIETLKQISEGNGIHEKLNSMKIDRNMSAEELEMVIINQRKELFNLRSKLSEIYANRVVEEVSCITS
ncbi:unnamed protein product [Didymodactylos carnosus]|uniref:Uncharacterized protein n=1 Tax=Didymodactylos carnosus TaxID=1234261 RepID=A0A814RXU7_9BILA|nr:unnamed protein product [Didymodactylos carnosus]CAF1139394.1 unnamed protein product [Didymodactylos carnosus]CAF3629205.1 unnamed protein product [Didymodactylos carnosus]CAF3903117.1 unnamed protein product [Didymodactylos carnosus]